MLAAMKLSLFLAYSVSVTAFTPSSKHYLNSKTGVANTLNLVESGRDLNIEVEEGINICYDAIKEEKPAGPPVLYLPGLLSPKSEGKSINLRAFCKKQGYTFLCADYYGTGKSSGNFIDGTVSRWMQDTIFLIEKLLLRQGQVVLVGHGVGTWIAFLVASKRPDLVSGIVGLAADPDFTEELLWKTLSDDVKNTIMTDGVCEIKWGNDKYLISRNLIEDGRKNLLLAGGKGSVKISCPVRLIHGLSDEQVPSSFAMRLLEACSCRDAAITLSKSSTHSMEEDGDMKAMRSMIKEVMYNFQGNYDLRSPGSG